MKYQIDIQYIKDDWPLILLALYFIRNFINNLLDNCPFLKANKVMEAIQGIFNAAVQAVVKTKDPNVNAP